MDHPKTGLRIKIVGGGFPVPLDHKTLILHKIADRILFTKITEKGCGLVFYKVAACGSGNRRHRLSFLKELCRLIYLKMLSRD